MFGAHFKGAVSLVGKGDFLDDLTPLQITGSVRVEGIIGIPLFLGDSGTDQGRFGLIGRFDALTPAG